MIIYPLQKYNHYILPNKNNNISSKIMQAIIKEACSIIRTGLPNIMIIKILIEISYS